MSAELRLVERERRWEQGTDDLYGSAEGRLWELVAGEMLHCGGISQPKAMAVKAGITESEKVLDLCSGFGSSLRFLAKNYNIQGYGLDISPYMIEQAKRRTREEGLQRKVIHLQGDVYHVPWPDNSFDVVWGEDGWCYLDAKEALIKEAVRVLKPGGSFHLLDFGGGDHSSHGSHGLHAHLGNLFHSSDRLKDNSETRILELMRRAGFTKVEKLKDGRMLFGLLRTAYYRATV